MCTLAHACPDMSTSNKLVVYLNFVITLVIQDTWRVMLRKQRHYIRRYQLMLSSLILLINFSVLRMRVLSDEERGLRTLAKYFESSK